MPTLFDPVSLGELRLANRIVMAPMTRSRAGAGDVPTAHMVDYYRQRASAGLIVTEGTQPSLAGKGYCRTPGLHTPEQVAGWRQVTDAVHAEGGRIAMQTSTAIKAKGKMFTDQAGLVEMDLPRALGTDEVPTVVAEYAHAAACAIEAGFDGVELHCASGYLPMQFLSTGTNHRTDRYGGRVENRIRFVVETIEAMAKVIGPGRIGLRICPGNPFNDISDADPAETYSALLTALSPMGLAYLHLIHLKLPEIDSLAVAEAYWRGPLILNESIDYEQGEALVAAGTADAISFGRPFIANPDLVARFRARAPLADFDRKTLYTPGTEGYSDYPPLSEE